MNVVIDLCTIVLDRVINLELVPPGLAPPASAPHELLVGKCLDRRIDSKDTIIAEVAAWEQRRNAERAQIQWMFTTEKAREKLQKAYPVKES
jgi:hypothetical protein